MSKSPPVFGGPDSDSCIKLLLEQNPARNNLDGIFFHDDLPLCFQISNDRETSEHGISLFSISFHWKLVRKYKDFKFLGPLKRTYEVFVDVNFVSCITLDDIDKGSPTS